MARLGQAVDWEACDLETTIANLAAEIQSEKPGLRLASLIRRSPDRQYVNLWTLLVHHAVASDPVPAIMYVSHFPAWGPCIAFEAGPAMSDALLKTTELLGVTVEALPAEQLGGGAMETYCICPTSAKKAGPLSLLGVYQGVADSGGTNIVFCFGVPSNTKRSQRETWVLHPVIGHGKRLQFRACNGEAHGLQRCAVIAQLTAALQLTASNVQRYSTVQWQTAAGNCVQQSLETLRHDVKVALATATAASAPASAASAPASTASAPVIDDVDVMAMAARLQEGDSDSSDSDDY